MFSLTRSLATIFRDFNTDGDTGSGARNPPKAEIRQWGNELESYLTVGAKQRLTTSSVVHVGPSGTDSEGFGLSPATPFATGTYAYNYIRERWDLAGWAGIISVAPGVYTTGFDFNGAISGDALDTGINVVGSVGDSGETTIIRPSSGYCVAVHNGARVYIRGLKFDGANSNSDLIYSGVNSKTIFDTVTFGDTNGHHDVQAGADTTVAILGNYRIRKSSFTKTCGLTSGNTTITCTDTSGIKVGYGAYSAAGNLPRMTIVISINPGVSVTLSHAPTATTSDSIQFSAGGLTHLQGDPKSYTFATTSIGDGGTNQIIVEVEGNPFYANGFVSYDSAVAQLSRVVFLNYGSVVGKTGTWSAGSATLTVNSISGLTLGQRVIHPAVPWGATISNFPDSTHVEINPYLTTAAATGVPLVFGAQALVNAVPFTLFNGARLDARMDQQANRSDVTALPGWTISVSASYTGGGNTFSVSGGDVTKIATYLQRMVNNRGLVVQNNDFEPGTSISSSSAVVSTTVTVSRPIRGTASGAILTIGGFAQSGSDYQGAREEPVIPGVGSSGAVPVNTTYVGGSGTYTTPVGAKYLIVEMVGGGGGGGGSGVSPSSTNGGAGSATTFGASLVCNGGSGGEAASATGKGGAGGTAAGGDINISGAKGTNAAGVPVSGSNRGGDGGSSFYGGSGRGGANNDTTGSNAEAASGAGGGGGASPVASGIGGGGGGSGGWLRKLIPSPASTYAYSVGAGAGGGSLGGSGGTIGFAGGAGASGLISVTAFF